MNKRWTLATVMVDAFIFIAQYVAGQHPTTIDCLDIAIEGQKTEIKCTIGDLQEGISWSRPNGDEVVFCEYSATTCTTAKQYEGQYVGVRDSLTEVRLLIKSFDTTTDAGEWACRDGHQGQDLDASKCIKTDKMEPITSVDCMYAGTEGYPTELKCKITTGLTMGIFWIRPDSAVVVKCSINNTRCTSTEGPPGQYTGVAHSSTANTLKIKSFDPKTEAGTWICRDGDHGAKSSCTKMHLFIGESNQNTTPATVPTTFLSRRLERKISSHTLESESSQNATPATLLSTEPGDAEYSSGEINWFLLIGVPIIVPLAVCAPVAAIIYWKKHKPDEEEECLQESFF